MKHVCLSILVVMLWCVMSNAQSSKTELKGRQSANPQPYCTPEGCDVGDTGAAAASTKANPNEVLAFQLFDVYGRQVDSADYAGVPVLIFFGSCWCGGCMEDTKPFRQLAGEYAGKGLVCLRTVAGDNELAALDFQNHFRLPMAHLMDPDRAFEKRCNRDGWTFLMLCDRKGRVVYTVHHFPDPGDENWKKLRAAIDRVLSSPVEHRALKRDGTIYMPATLQRSGESQSDRLNERFASMTCAPDGKNKWHNVPRHGSRGKKVCLRRFEHNAWSEELEISPTDVPQHEKHFDPAIWPCENGVIVAWSWDFHPPNKGYSVFAESPTIFIRPVDDNMGMGRITSVSGKNIDLAPAIGVSRNHQVWSAWDSQSGNRKKQICIASPAIGSDLAPDQIQALDGNMKNVCTPAFVQRPDGGLALLWSETKDGKQWMLRETEFDAVKNQWSQPQVVQSQGNPRFASGAYDKQGHLWVAYSAETERGREIFATKAGNLSHP